MKRIKIFRNHFIGNLEDEVNEYLNTFDSEYDYEITALVSMADEVIIIVEQVTNMGY